MEPSKSELERLFNVLAEGLESRLASAGYEPGEDVPAPVLAQLTSECFDSVSPEAILPEFVQSLANAAGALGSALADASDPSKSPNERMVAQGKVQAACEADPVLKAYLLNNRAAIVAELYKLKEHFQSGFSY